MYCIGCISLSGGKVNGGHEHHIFNEVLKGISIYLIINLSNFRVLHRVHNTVLDYDFSRSVGEKSGIDSDRGFVKLKSEESNGVVVVQSKVWKVKKKRKKER